jgi:hypothetical protein
MQRDEITQGDHQLIAMLQEACKRLQTGLQYILVGMHALSLEHTELDDEGRVVSVPSRASALFVDKANVAEYLRREARKQCSPPAVSYSSSNSYHLLQYPIVVRGVGANYQP